MTGKPIFKKCEIGFSVSPRLFHATVTKRIAASTILNSGTAFVILKAQGSGFLFPILYKEGIVCVRAVLNVSIVLNAAVFEEIKESGIMKEAVERLFKKEMEEQRQEGRQEGFLEALSGLVRKGLLSLTDAAKEAGLSPAEFQSKTAGMR